MRNCFQTRERAGDARRRAPKLLEGAESAARTPKVTSSCAFSAVDWWTHRLSPTQATLTPTVGDFLFHILSFLSSSHCCFACSCRVTPTDELQSFRGTYVSFKVEQSYVFVFYDVGFTYIYCAYRQMSWLFGKRQRKEKKTQILTNLFHWRNVVYVLCNYWYVKKVILVVNSN